MEKDIQFKKNFIWNIIGTGFNAFNSLFFMIAITRINGVDNAGIYTIAYSTACILYMIGIYAGRIYQVTESNKTITNKDYIFNRMISCSIIFVISILFVIIKRYDMYKSSIFIILALYKSLEAFSDVLYGILQKNNFLDKAGKSCFIKALLSLIVFILIDIFTHNLIIACLSIVGVYLVIILFYDYRQVRNFIGNTEKVEIKNPKDAQKLSIAAIYQHGTAYQHLSVTENIFIGHEKMTKFHTIDWKQMHKDAKALLERLGSDIDPHSSMGNLTVAEQQIVEIAKAISTNAKIIIMDEPTAALSKRECEELYRITEQLRDEGCSIIFISHRFEDMYRLATRVTVFRDSQYIGTWNVDEISNEVLISKMVGREISQIYPKQEVERGEEIFRVEGLSKTGYYKDVSFSLHKGEILAMTGLVGAGRTEVCQGIMGIERPDKGKVILEGKTLSIRHPSDAMKAGIGYLPEDRQKQGLILDWGLGQNVTLSTLEKFTKFTVINRKAERERSKELLEKVKTKALSVFDKASSLSGGNQQKVIVAKVLNSDLKVVILDEPTKGVDVGAKAQIYEIMSELAAQGFGVIMISSEIPEIMGMADTILVMKDGEIVENGTHENLVKKDGVYASLWKNYVGGQDNEKEAM